MTRLQVCLAIAQVLICWNTEFARAFAPQSRLRNAACISKASRIESHRRSQTRLYYLVNFDSNDAFEILNLSPSPGLDKNAIKRAYKKIALNYHPDIVVTQKSSQDEKKCANDRFAKINWAYETLMGKRKDLAPSAPSAATAPSKARSEHTQPHGRATRTDASNGRKSDDVMDRNLRTLLETGTLEEVGTEMRDTNLVSQQLSRKLSDIEDELTMIQMDLRVALRYFEIKVMQEKAAELQARRGAVEVSLTRSRNRLQLLQSRYTELISARAGEHGDASQKSTPASGTESAATNKDWVDTDGDWKHQGFGSSGRGGRGNPGRSARPSTSEHSNAAPSSGGRSSPFYYTAGSNADASTFDNSNGRAQSQSETNSGGATRTASGGQSTNSGSTPPSSVYSSQQKSAQSSPSSQSATASSGQRISTDPKTFWSNHPGTTTAASANPQGTKAEPSNFSYVYAQKSNGRQSPPRSARDPLDPSQRPEAKSWSPYSTAKRPTPRTSGTKMPPPGASTATEKSTFWSKYTAASATPPSHMSSEGSTVSRDQASSFWSGYTTASETPRHPSSQTPSPISGDPPRKASAAAERSTFWSGYSPASEKRPSSHAPNPISADPPRRSSTDPSPLWAAYMKAPPPPSPRASGSPPTPSGPNTQHVQPSSFWSNTNRPNSVETRSPPSPAPSVAARRGSTRPSTLWSAYANSPGSSARDQFWYATDATGTHQALEDGYQRFRELKVDASRFRSQWTGQWKTLGLQYD